MHKMLLLINRHKAVAVEVAAEPVVAEAVHPPLQISHTVILQDTQFLKSHRQLRGRPSRT